MDCQNTSLITTIISVCIPTIFGIAGWFVIDRQNRKLRKEEAKRAMYDKLFTDTNNIIKNLIGFKTLAENNTNRVAEILLEIPSANADDKKHLIEEWGRKIAEISRNAYNHAVSILDYMRILDFGGTDFGRESNTYQALNSVSIDTNTTLMSLSRRWVEFTNFGGMNQSQIDELISETKADFKQLDEFCGCLEDTLVYVYNLYIAIPLQLPKRVFKIKEPRRYVTEKGLIDNRAFN